MDKNQFRAALEDLRLSCEDFATLTGWSRATVYDWGARTPIPHPVRCILALLAERNGVSLNVSVDLPSAQRRPAPAAAIRAERFRI
jgi:hypothetical protein